VSNTKSSATAEEAHALRVQPAKQRLRNAFIALETAAWRNDTSKRITRLKTLYLQTLTAYEATQRKMQRSSLS